MSHINKIQKLAYASFKVSRIALILLKSSHMLIIFILSSDSRMWYRLLLTSSDTFSFINIPLITLKEIGNKRVIAIFAFIHSNPTGFAYSQNADAQLISGLPALTTLSFISSWWLTIWESVIELQMELTSSYSSRLVVLGTDIFSAIDYWITYFFKVRWCWRIFEC